MNTRKLLLLISALVGLTAMAYADTRAAEATVAKITGKATMTLPNGTSTDLTAGAKVPQGATITTAADGEVYLQTFAGTVATIKAGSNVSVDELSITSSGGKVTEEKTMLNLKSGNLVSALDPAKRNVNNYQVRTPKGVAAARGTTFTVQVNGQTYTVVTTSGAVQITTPTGDIVNVSAGQASVSSHNGGAATPVSQLPAAAKADAIAAMAVAVGTIAVAADQGMLGASGSAEVQAAATTVMTAAPEAAASVAATVASVAPSQNSAVTNAASAVATATGNTSLNTTVQQTQQSTPPASSTTPTTPASPSSTPTPTTQPTTTPQPIDPSTVSRSG